MSVRDKEPFSPDFRYDTIVKTLKDIADNRLEWHYVPSEWDEEGTSEYKKCEKDFGVGGGVFCNPMSTPAQLEAIESKFFSSIMFLKMNGLLRPVVNRDEILASIARIDLKQDALSALLKDILIVLTELTERVEALGKN
jgi:hypothetical protein